MPSKRWEGFEFSYETNASCSFLVIGSGIQERILDYQVSMVEHNSIDRMIPFEAKRRNGCAYFYYNITSRLQLSFFLKRRKLARDEFIRLLADIAKTLVDCAGYLLTDTSFVIDADYIFINPETCELSFVYIPVESSGDIGDILKDFVADLVLHHANIDESESDNFLQRILGYVKKDTFNVKEFLGFLSTLLYAAEDVSPSIKPGDDPGVKLDVKPADKGIKPNFGAPHRGAGQLEGIKPASTIMHINAVPLIIALLLQALLVTAVVISFRYAASKSSSPGTTQAAVGIIAGALDLLFLKNLLYKKRIITKEIVEGKTAAPAIAARGLVQGSALNTPVPQDLAPKRPAHNSPASEKRQNEGAGAAYVETAAASSTAAPHPMQGDGNTVLLGHSKKGIPVLLSKNNADQSEIVLDKPDFVIGRLAGQVDHVCRNNAIGKVHCQFVFREGTYYIKDLNSVNGTFINNNRIESNKEYALKDNDVITLANSEYLFILK